MDEIRQGLEGLVKDCSRIEPTRKSALQFIFSQITVHPDDILVDIGCGDGGVIAHWLDMGLTNRLIGMELHAQTWMRTEAKFATQRNVEIKWGDASRDPPKGTLYYLFNPFKGERLKTFEAALPAGARIIFNNPKDLSAFEGWTKTYLEPWSTYARGLLMERHRGIS